jgi:hypothetical protein
MQIYLVSAYAVQAVPLGLNRRSAMSKDVEMLFYFCWMFLAFIGNEFIVRLG